MKKMNSKTQAKIDRWTAAELPDDLSQQLAALNQTQLEDAFYQDIAFGTAGMRGQMGVGTNRLNSITVAQTTKALANHILADNLEQAGVVISYDSRNNSALFAQVAAQVLAAANIVTYLFDGPHPTPELSFAVRHLKTYAGIMITASHNPKEDNGYKLYGPDGGQLAPTAAEKIIEERQKLLDVFEIQQSVTGIQMIGKDIDQSYLDQLKTVSLDHELIAKNGDQLQLAFTPLHGAGGNLTIQALHQAGFSNVTVIDQQFAPDGNFPTVKKPNPEDPQVFALAQETNLPVLIAIDPDGDRMGVAVKRADQYQMLTGNQIAVILFDYISSHLDPTNKVLVTSNVSSIMPSVIAKQRGIDSIIVHTGFKWIAETIANLENSQRPQEFIFGFEESFGYLIKPFVRDKDALQASLLISEIVLKYQLAHQTILDRLEQLYQEFGYYQELTLSIDFAGESGRHKMEAIIDQLRKQPIEMIADLTVKQVVDYLKLEPAANLLRYQLVDDSWFAIRPSGTEPKLKLYLGAVADDQAQAAAKLAKLSQQLKARIEEK